MFNNTGYGGGKSNSFGIMATANNTTVNISNISPGVIFRGTTPVGVPLTSPDVTVTLNAGESYVIANFMNEANATNNTNGANGTHITSDKDIVVNCATWLGGNARNGTLPNSPISNGRDIGIDQIVPVEAVGDEYLLIKGEGIDNERTIVIATEDNTDIFLDGNAAPVATLANAGDFYVIEGTAFNTTFDNLYLTSSSPVYIYQTTNGASFTSNNERQSGLMFLPPVGCSGGLDVFLPNVDSIGTAFINIIANTGANIYVDGVLQGNGNPVTGTTDYVTYKLTNGFTGDVHITSDQLIRVALINVSGNIGASGYFSGFTKDFNVQTNTVNGDDITLEGCIPASFTFGIDAPISTPTVLTYQVWGTATNGIDYDLIDTSLTIPAGQTQATVFINSIQDGLIEGQESVFIVYQPDICSPLDTAILYIDDAQPIEFTLDETDLTCYDNYTGEVQVNTVGGFAPYNFDVTDSQGNTVNHTNNPITGLAAGTYSVIIYDAYGCKADAIVIGGIFDADTLFLPDGNGVTYTSQIPISGFGNGAKIDSLSQILQICANMEHSYLGDLELRLTSPSGQICVLKEQNGGGSCDLGEPYASGPVDGANSNLIDPGVGYEYCWNSTPTYVTMVGESNNFSHTIPSSTGGTYTDNFLPPGSYQSFDPLNNLLGSTMDGNWTLEITDQFGLDNGYVFNWNISLVGGAPDTLVVINQPDSILVNGSITQAQCGGNDGAIDITVSGANSPFTFLWSNGSTDEDISGLTADNYTVIVSDITGCSDTTTFSLNNISSINIVSSVTDVSCVGGNNGDITVTTSGGTPHYIFSWSNGASDEDISGLTAGTYTLSIEDALGCEFSESITVGTLPAISISLNNTSNEFCGQANGSIDINVTGGSGSYGFSWDNGAISEDISSLAAGTYIITVTDGNNCSANATFTITNNTGTLAASASVSSEICGNSGGAINLIPTGNAGILTFLWSNGATSEDLNNIPAGLYSCTITDANGCVLVSPQYNVINESSTLLLTNTVINNENCGNGQGSIDITIQGGSIPIDFAWDNGDITEDITGLSAGTFSCTITDGNGCQVQTGTLNLFNTPGNLNVTTDLVTNEICNNGAGAINVTTTGGTNPIIYSWDNGSTSEDISGLIAGTYNLTVTDFNGCVFNHSETVTNTSGTLQIDNAVLTDENCNDGTGSIDLIISGDAPFIFNWDNGQTIEDISGLSAGNYFVTVSDANGCEVSQSYTINNNTGNLSVSSIGTAEFCSNSNGSIDITVNGGTMPYNFLWSNGSTDEDLTGISSGIYTCTITDDLGCSVLTSNISISNNPGTLSFIDSTQNESCGNGAGAIELFVSGGTPGYTFTWSPNVSNNAIATNLSAVGLDISKALHNSVMVYFPVLHSQINSIFCSIVVVSFQGIIICFLFQITP